MRQRTSHSKKPRKRCARASYGVRDASGAHAPETCVRSSLPPPWLRQCCTTSRVQRTPNSCLECPVGCGGGLPWRFVRAGGGVRAARVAARGAGDRRGRAGAWCGAGGTGIRGAGANPGLSRGGVQDTLGVGCDAIGASAPLHPSKIKPGGNSFVCNPTSQGRACAHLRLAKP